MTMKPEHTAAARDEHALTARLLERIARRDRQAMDYFYAIHAGDVYRLALAVVHDAPTAADVLTRVMLEAWRGAAECPPASAGNWLFAIALRCAREAAAACAPAARVDDRVAAVTQASTPERTIDWLRLQVTLPTYDTPGDFGLDRVWAALDAELRVLRRRALRRRVLRGLAGIRRFIRGLGELPAAAA